MSIPTIPLTAVAKALVTWWDPGLPADHQCRKACTHGDSRGRAMIDRVEDLKVPTMELARKSAAGRMTRGAPAGSPAPWWAPAGELADAVLRQAVRDYRALYALGGHPREPRMRVRKAIPVDPDPNCRLAPRCGHDRCRGWTWSMERLRDVDVELAGRWAIRHLPRLVEETEACTARDPHRVEALAVEMRLRVAMARCEVLLGVRQPEVRLDRMRNLDYGRLEGPTCAPPGMAPWQPPACEHQECYRVWAAKHLPSAVPWCPFCGLVSLRIDPVTEVTRCSTRRCVDPETGRQPQWTREELAQRWDS